MVLPFHITLLFTISYIPFIISPYLISNILSMEQTAYIRTHRKSDFIDAYRALFRLATTKLSMLGVCTQQKSRLFYIMHIQEQAGSSYYYMNVILYQRTDSGIVICSYLRLHFCEKHFMDLSVIHTTAHIYQVRYIP